MKRGRTWGQAPSCICLCCVIIHALSDMANLHFPNNAKVVLKKQSNLCWAPLRLERTFQKYSGRVWFPAGRQTNARILTWPSRLGSENKQISFWGEKCWWFWVFFQGCNSLSVKELFFPPTKTETYRAASLIAI